MQLRLIAVSAASVLACSLALQAAAQVTVQQSTTIYCPPYTTTGVPTERAPEGWVNGGYSTAKFNRREIRANTLYCLYGANAEFSIFTTTPSDTQCTTDPNWPIQFTCSASHLKPLEPVVRIPPPVPH